MKLKIFALLIALGTSVYGQGTFTYHFDVSTLAPTGQDSLRESHLSLIAPVLGGGGGDIYELFEGAPTGAPAQSGAFGGAPYVSLFDGIWADREGSFRITVPPITGTPEGELNFTAVSIHLAIPTASNPFLYDYYDFITPVPEPTSAVLILLGLLIVTSCGRKIYGSAVP